LNTVIFHIDVNSAFLSWEAIYRLKHKRGKVDLRTIPSAVGGNEESRHGIVVAKSIACKPYNIKTGESLMEARKKCPTLLVVPPHYNLYDKCSKAFMSVLHEYSPDVEQYSIDEAFIDMTGTECLWGDPVTAAHRIKNHIERKLGFTVNIGISSNKLLAKMASDFKKPNMVHTLWPDEIEEKMWPLPVTDLFYVGRATFSKLNRLGVRTIGDLAQFDLNILKQHLKSHGVVVWNFANGNDSSDLVPQAPANKGYGNSTTTPYDICNQENANMVLLSLAETLGMRLRKDSAKIGVISIGIKYSDFSYKSHQCILKQDTDITKEIYDCAIRLYEELWDKVTPVRHIGIHTSRAKGKTNFRQLSFFDTGNFGIFDGTMTDFERQERLDSMTDEIRMNFGMDALKRAVFIRSRIDASSGGISREKMDVDYDKQVIH